MIILAYCSSTSNPSDGDASQLRVGKAEQESSARALLQHVFRLLPSHEPNDGAKK